MIILIVCKDRAIATTTEIEFQDRFCISLTASIIVIADGKYQLNRHISTV
jgi:hypothetical protein